MNLWFFVLIVYYSSNYAEGRGFTRQEILRNDHNDWNVTFELGAGNISSILKIEKRQVASTASSITCGYIDGLYAKARPAQIGYDCRFDTIHALWGFCPTTVIAATDCGLAGNCVDNYACSTGCGMTGVAGITTFTCLASKGNPYCSTILLTEGVDQVYSYIGCGATAITDHMLAIATDMPTSVSTVTIPQTIVISPTPAPGSTTSTAAPSTTTSTSSKSTASITTSSTSSSSSSSSSSFPQASQTAQINSSSTSTLLQASITNVSTTTTSTSNTGTTTNTTIINHTTLNLGPLVGGILGGLFLLVALIFLVLYLRMRSRIALAKQDPSFPSPGRSRSGRWLNIPRTTPMQTAGLHEVEGSGVDGKGGKRFEADGKGVRGVMFEIGGKTPVTGREKKFDMPKTHRVFELPEESVYI